MELVEHLCEVLDEETRVSADLARVLRAEQRAVVELRPETLLVCLEERCTLQDELVGLANRRRALVRGLARACGVAETTDSLTTILPRLPGGTRAPLRPRLSALRGALLEARGLERQTALLVGNGLETVGDVLRAIAALVPGARYDAGAQVAPIAGVDQVDRRV